MIYHITGKLDWDKAKQSESYTAESLNTEGFIHCSLLRQIRDTANLFFKGQKKLVILCVDEAKLSSVCKYENPTLQGKPDPDVGNLFPHIYGPINLSSIVKVVKFPPDEHGLFNLPEELIILMPQ